MSPEKVRRFRRSLLRWFYLNTRELPWRRTCDPYAILVSEFMLQQTQVATVIPYYNKWLLRFPDFDSVARASQNDVLHVWQGLGYYSRARNLHAASKIVRDQYSGILPGDIEALRKLPGVGRYIANAVATFAFNQSVPIVEANSSRVLARLLDMQAPIDSAMSRGKLWEYATRVVPKLNPARFNSALIDLGALVCVPNRPKCTICPVKGFCRAKNPETLPIKKNTVRTRRLVEQHAFVVRNGRVLLEQSFTRWRGMWILPRLEAEAFDRPLYRSTFPFTNHRIGLLVYRRPTPKRIGPTQKWFKSIEDIAMPSPHRRAAQALLTQNKDYDHAGSGC